MIRLHFFGTSPFAAPSLERLARDARFRVVAVVTQPDRPVGRHAERMPSPVKTAAVKLRLPVLQFEDVKRDEALNALKNMPADVAVVASFGQIIPQRLLDLYPHGMVNLHGSLLPEFRGASPIAAAIREGRTETGVTVMKMDALLDHGPVLSAAKETIRPDDTGGTLHDRLAEIGARILPDVLADYAGGKILPKEQDHAHATMVKTLTREDGKIDWNKQARDIDRMVRAYDPWPGTYMESDGKRLKILKTDAGGDCSADHGSRTIIDGYPAVVCGDGKVLRLLRVQPEGKQAMDGKDFLRGHGAWLRPQ